MPGSFIYVLLVSKHVGEGANSFITYAFGGFVDEILVTGFGLDTDWPQLRA